VRARRLGAEELGAFDEAARALLAQREDLREHLRASFSRYANAAKRVGIEVLE
jgi:hypothetical protein